MPTIKDLVEKHSKVPGDIRVGHPEFLGNGAYFRPFFCADGNWYGLDENAMHCSVGDDYHDATYSLFEEPPPKVKRWQGWEMYPTPKVKRAQYLVIDPRQRRPYCTGDWCTDEKDARDSILYRDTSSAVFIRLTETEREFDR